ncbi:hypothetical protein KUTeg_005852 [Tegillarca granosa]|uniref:Uncharacterized protein n=1 Tax=Tegillarca granosa TaxID=220873 RepID=A0ABQ9FH16_TEGGR|nr:hypothetical protein KUTeg_005852 [Tegillarca granosa]
MRYGNMKISEERMWKLQQLESLILKMVPVLLSFSQVKTGQFMRVQNIEVRNTTSERLRNVVFQQTGVEKMLYIRLDHFIWTSKLNTKSMTRKTD